MVNIILHCSASDWGCARVIRGWHTNTKPMGNGWSDIGYHFVILNGRPAADLHLFSLDGSIELGRALDGNRIIDRDEMGIHTLGYNQNSIGICMIGQRDKRTGALSFTVKQFDALKALTADLCRQYALSPKNVLGHCETESGQAQGKTCPDFDVGAIRTWLSGRL